MGESTEALPEADGVSEREMGTYKGEAFQALSSVDLSEAVADARVHAGVGLTSYDNMFNRVVWQRPLVREAGAWP